MKTVAVSACLMGKNVRYNGTNKKDEELISLLKNHRVVMICPEVFGGLTIPHPASEILNDKVVGKDGTDVTSNFITGARKTLNIVLQHHCDFAILKTKSPSCGKGKVYDGTFTGTLTDGDGIFTGLLKKQGIPCFGENEIEEIKKLLK